MLVHPHELEEIEFQDGPRLWDITPGVCCAAAQLGACNHSEGAEYDFGDDEDPVHGPWLAEVRWIYAAADLIEEPF